MKPIYNFVGKIPRMTPNNEVANLIRHKIAEQQAQFNTGQGDNNPENIILVDYAHVDAEPNCKLVYAQWSIK